MGPVEIWNGEGVESEAEQDQPGHGDADEPKRVRGRAVHAEGMGEAPEAEQDCRAPQPDGGAPSRLDQPEGMVKSRIRSGLRRLRSHLADAGITTGAV